MRTNLFLVTFYLDIFSNLQNSYKYGMRNFHIYFVKFTTVYIFPYFSILCVYIHVNYVLNQLRVSWRHHTPLSLNAMYMFPKSEGSFIYLLFFWPCCVACGILVLWPRTEPMRVWREWLGLWTAREFPRDFYSPQFLCMTPFCRTFKYILSLKKCTEWATKYHLEA